MTRRIDREKALAFRLSGHNLARRLPPGALLDAAGACGVQNSPPGSAPLALHARVEGLTPEDVDRALSEEKTLLQAWSLRQSPHLFPTRDAAVFTAGLLPEEEEEWRFVLAGFVPILEKVGMGAAEAVGLAEEALRDALDGRELTKREMGTELAKRLPEELPIRGWSPTSSAASGRCWCVPCPPWGSSSSPRGRATRRRS